eukprot:COSAG01_NODE_40644_length_461_cov_0.878453_1_plen_21_part_01
MYKLILTEGTGLTGVMVAPLV